MWTSNRRQRGEVFSLQSRLGEIRQAPDSDEAARATLKSTSQKGTKDDAERP